MKRNRYIKYGLLICIVIIGAALFSMQFSKPTAYPHYDQWVKRSSDERPLSFKFSENGSFMANYSKNSCCVNVFSGNYKITRSVIILDFDLSTQSVIDSRIIPFSWDGEILKLKIDGEWEVFELTRR